MPPKRGRPRNVDSLTASPAISRPSSTRRSGRLEPAAGVLINTKTNTSAFKDEDKEDESDMLSLAVLSEGLASGTKKDKKTVVGRDSLSSISNSVEPHEGSGYSTPATSAAPTPLLKKTSINKRGRRPATMTGESSTPAVNAVARAAALRNSQFSMSMSGSYNKRKRVADSYDDEDGDEDDSVDAQLARALQEQEDTAAISMAIDEDNKEDVPRRASRKARKILPKVNYASEFEEDEDADEDSSLDNQLGADLQPYTGTADISMLMADEEMYIPYPASPRARKILPIGADLQPYKGNADISMLMADEEMYILYPAPRRARKILPKVNYASEFEEDEDNDDDADEDFDGSSSLQAKRPKVELGSKGKNLVKFSSSKSTKKIIEIDDSEESADIMEIDDTDESPDFMDIDGTEDSDVPIALSKSMSALRASTSKSVAKSSPETPATPAKRKNSKATAGPFSLKRNDTKVSTATSGLSDLEDAESDFTEVEDDELSLGSLDTDDSDVAPTGAPRPRRRPAAPSAMRRRIAELEGSGTGTRRERQSRARLETQHPELLTMWDDLESLPKIGNVTMDQPKNISRELKPFQLQGVAWMMAMEKTDWAGGLLGDEMGMGKTIQAVSLIMSDYPAKVPSLVLIPPVAIMQWQQEIKDYTDGTLKTFVYHGTNSMVKDISYKKLMTYDVILMSYNSLESMFRKQEKGFKRKGQLIKEESVMHKIHFHRVILDEAHSIKSRTTGSAKACFALKANHKWCLSGTPLQNRIGEFFSLVRFLDIRPFACYMCKQCPCSNLSWDMNEDNRCSGCNHGSMQHVSVFNQELLNPIQKFGNSGPGKEAFRKLAILTGRFMLRRVKRDHSSAMELPAKEIYVDRQFFGEEENDFAGSIMNSGTRKFETYVAQGVLLNNYANVFGLIMQMRQVADHPDLILKKNGDGGQNVIVCCICDETAEEAIRSACKHDFCRECAKSYLASSDTPDCPQCHIALAIDLEQPDLEQDENQVKKSSIINRIKMENWTSSSKIETLVHDLHELRSKNMSHKSIIFSQFTTMLQLVEWRLRRAGITTVMLDGSMTPAQRQASINHFKTDINVECFLVSLKAGGVALNLTEASKVFIVDPWWNPAAEWQSADRCHRIGQGRPCQITRLCIEDSVESRMVLLQEKKANMINSTINSDQKAMESLTPEDMQFLFRGS